MKKTIFFVIASLSFFTACQKEIRPLDERFSGNVEANGVRATHPNIILIVGDDIGYEILRCNGGQSYQTPNLDNLAARGRRFTRCHASPLCCPSRFSLLTGKYNFRNYEKWGVMDSSSNKTIGNMMQDAGYATCYAGKWQLDGYDASIRGLGWGTYRIWEPGKEGDGGSRYKNPHLYENGSFLPDSATLNKYGEDMLVDYITAFTKNVTKPYFVYYAMTLAHAPFCPTPDNPEFASWDPNNRSDPKFYPSMIKYMDKKIGQLLSRIDSNTVVIYVGDNGTPKDITSLWNGISIPGGKSQCTEYGTHVPLIVYKQGKSPRLDSSLVDLTDFIPTLASIAKIPTPQTYGVLDGTPFFPETSTRQWLYYHYNPYPTKGNAELTIWAENSSYKKYDTTVSLDYLPRKDNLYNITLDITEQNAILPLYQSTQERAIDSTLESIMHSYALQQ